MNSRIHRNGAIATGIFFIVFAIFLLVLGLSDFDANPGAAMFAALLAFIGGIAGASSRYWNLAANVRPR